MRLPIPSDHFRIRERLNAIPGEIGQAHRAGNEAVKARLYAEKAMHLEVLTGRRGTGEILAQAQKEAAEALDKAGSRRAALEFYRKAFETRSRLIAHLAGKTGIRRNYADDIARLKALLEGNPDPATKARLERELRAQGLMRPDETLRYEVNIEEVEKLIAGLETQKGRAEKEVGFARTQLAQAKADLHHFQTRIKHLEDQLSRRPAPEFAKEHP